MNISILLSDFFAESRRAIRRYPLSLGAALLATCMATLLMLSINNQVTPTKLFETW